MWRSTTTALAAAAFRRKQHQFWVRLDSSFAQQLVL
jgi:hypothetical protein